MTERQNEQVPTSVPQPKDEQDKSAPAETPVSDRQVQGDQSGEHGRPTDDSDPGHS